MFLEKGIIMVPKAHSVGSHRRGVAKLQREDTKMFNAPAAPLEPLHKAPPFVFPFCRKLSATSIFVGASHKKPPPSSGPLWGASFPTTTILNVHTSGLHERELRWRLAGAVQNLVLLLQRAQHSRDAPSHHCCRSKQRKQTRAKATWQNVANFISQYSHYLQSI